MTYHQICYKSIMTGFTNNCLPFRSTWISPGCLLRFVFLHCFCSGHSFVDQCLWFSPFRSIPLYVLRIAAFHLLFGINPPYKYRRDCSVRNWIDKLGPVFYLYIYFFIVQHSINILMITCRPLMSLCRACMGSNFYIQSITYKR